MKKLLLFIFAIINMCIYAQTFPIGHMSINFKDASRSGGYSISGGIAMPGTGRNIGTEVYYPATVAGNNTAAAAGQFPIVVFGHGFAMTYDNYDNIYNRLASMGYIVLLPRTESGIFPTPNHAEFAADLKSLTAQGMLLNTISTPTALVTFNGKVLQKSAIGGHSMGGGCSYIAAQNNSTLTCLFNLAAATSNTAGVSSVAGASLVTVPTLVVSGQLDNVADSVVQKNHYIPTASSKKFLAVIKGVTHCDFGNGTSGTCTIGQAACSGAGCNATLFARYMTYIEPFLANQLKNDCAEGNRFMDSINSTSSNRVGRRITGTIAASINVAITGTTTLCSGTQATLTASGASSYTWTNGIINGIAFTPTVTQTYSVTATNSVGCIKTFTAQISVNNSPTVTATSSNSLLCSGNTSTLNAFGATNYTWTAGPTNAIYAVTPTITTTYTVIGIAANGCTNKATQLVIVNALPIVVANTTNSVICFGSTTTLSGAGATSYTWSNGVTNNIAFTPTTSVNYSVTGTDANGCMNTATKLITVNNLPTVTASTSNSVICLGNSTTLTGNGANTYTWSSAVINNTAFNPTITATYTVNGTDANGCMNTATKLITVNNLPTVTASTSNSVICLGNSTTLTGNGANTYTWSSAVINNTAFNPTITTTYTVTGTDANGCMNTATKLITVNNLPIVTASTSNSVICLGNSTTLTGNGANTYTWSSAVINNASFNPTITTTYTVTGTDANGCINTANKLITVNALPIIVAITNNTMLCSGEASTLTASGAVNYSWTAGPSTSLNVVTPSVTTTYSVLGEDLNGCSNSSSITQSVSVCTGINYYSILNTASIYPNPTDGKITISFQSTFGEEILYTLFDITGKTVFKEAEQVVLNFTNKEINIVYLTSGIYILNISQKGVSRSYKVIKN